MHSVTSFGYALWDAARGFGWQLKQLLYFDTRDKTQNIHFLFKKINKYYRSCLDFLGIMLLIVSP